MPTTIKYMNQEDFDKGKRGLLELIHNVMPVGIPVLDVYSDNLGWDTGRIIIKLQYKWKNPDEELSKRFHSTRTIIESALQDLYGYVDVWWKVKCAHCDEWVETPGLFRKPLCDKCYLDNYNKSEPNQVCPVCSKEFQPHTGFSYVVQIGLGSFDRDCHYGYNTIEEDNKSGVVRCCSALCMYERFQRDWTRINTEIVKDKIKVLAEDN